MASRKRMCGGRERGEISLLLGAKAQTRVSAGAGVGWGWEYINYTKLFIHSLIQQLCMDADWGQALEITHLSLG